MIFSFIGVLLLFGAFLNLLLFRLLQFFFFSTLGRQGTIGIALALTLFFVLTFYSFFAAQLSTSQVTQALYAVSGVWMGLVFYLLLFLAAIKLVVLVFSLPASALFSCGMAWVVMALSVGFYGVYNAQNPTVAHIPLTLSGVPEAWKGKRIAQISDVHLGALYGKEFVTKIVNQVNEQNPEMVVITGDLFDGTAVAEDVLDPIALLKAPQGIYFVSGNHDAMLKGSVQETMRAKMKAVGITILAGESVSKNGLHLLGVDYLGMNAKDQLAQAIQNIANFSKENFNVLLYHIPTAVAENEQLGVNLQLFGHTHCGQLLPFNFLVDSLYKWFGGGLNTTGNGAAYTSCGVGGWRIPMRTSGKSEIAVFEF